MANDILLAYLDELGSSFRGEIAMHARGVKGHTGFDNDTIIWYIMAWTKIAIVSNGNGYRKDSRAFLDKRDLPKLSANWKRSQEAARSLGTFSDYVGNGNSASGDFFNRTDKAMMDFFVDYRQHTAGMDDKGPNSEKDFIQKVKQFTVLRPDEVLKKEIFNMDRSI